MVCSSLLAVFAVMDDNKNNRRVPFLPVKGVIMDLAISQEAYEKYLNRKDAISNTRLRPDDEDFFDALMSVDMTATPEGREILDTIRKLK